jgi:HPt (histidine-containing phosphotransfer) domain-containing protein
MTIEALKQVDGLNVEQGIKNCMDDESLFITIIGMYIDQILEYLPQIEQFNANQEWEEYGKIAHSIKGASASAGLEKVQEMSKLLEQSAKEGNFEVLSDNHATYMALLDSTLDKLKAAL